MFKTVVIWFINFVLNIIKFISDAEVPIYLPKITCIKFIVVRDELIYTLQLFYI